MSRKIIYGFSRLFGFPFYTKKGVSLLLKMTNKIKEVEQTPGDGLTFTINHYKDGWIATCKELPNIYTSGTEIDPSFALVGEYARDALFTAFGMPAYMSNPKLFTSPQEEVEEIRQRQTQDTQNFSIDTGFAHA